MVTGRGLAGVIRIHFPKRVLYICTFSLFAANAFNIGADLGARAKGEVGRVQKQVREGRNTLAYQKGGPMACFGRVLARI